MTRRRSGEPRHDGFGVAFFAVALTTLVYVANVVARHTIAVVEARRLLPRWDLATHLVLGWTDYHLLTTGRLHRLVWDLWLQGYWPPMLSIYQVPFYLVVRDRMSAGLWSSLAAFVLAGITGCVVLWRQWKSAALLPAGIFVALLISSPYLLAYASVTMTEMLGALAELVLILSYAGYRQHPTERSARTFAVALTLLFFTKYNYFFLLIVPLGVYEWLDGTSGRGAADRFRALARSARRTLSSPSGVLITLYVAALLIVLRTGGFDVEVFGRRISVHTIGNTGHAVLYILLARLLYLHRRGRIDWVRLTSADLRVRPLLLWFVLPVTIWFASPYPNHIRDFTNLVFNRPLGEPTASRGMATYVDALRSSYFYNEWILLVVVAAFVSGAFRYRQQPPWMQWLILAIPIQFAAITAHQTRFPRFLLLTVVLLCLASASELGRWAAGSVRGKMSGAALAPAILFCGVLGAREAVTQYRFQTIAFENYTQSAALAGALDSIRAELTAADRLVIVGEGNELSPALFRWELGPPSRAACFPFQMGGAARLDPSLATRVLLLEPLASDAGPLDVTSYYLAQRRMFLDRAGRGEFALRREIPIEDLHVAFRLYQRTSAPERVVRCE